MDWVLCSSLAPSSRLSRSTKLLTHAPGTLAEPEEKQDLPRSFSFLLYLCDTFMTTITIRSLCLYNVHICCAAPPTKEINTRPSSSHHPQVVLHTHSLSEQQQLSKTIGRLKLHCNT